MITIFMPPPPTLEILHNNILIILKKTFLNIQIIMSNSFRDFIGTVLKQF